MLVGAGLPEGYAAILADSDLGIGRGELYTASGHLRRLLGRAPATMRQVVADAVASTSPAAARGATAAPPRPPAAGPVG